MRDGRRGLGKPAEPTVSRREALRITAAVGLASTFGGALTWAALRQAGLHRVRETRTRMGTIVTLTVVHDDAAAANAIVRAAFDRMERLEATLSRHREDTAVGVLNRRGVVHAPPPELVEVLTHARSVSEASGGAFDVTVAPVLRLHERVFEERGLPPTDREVAEALALVDYRRLQVDADDVRLQVPGMGITLDGVAKGYIVDRTVDVFVEAGADRVLVDAGGDMSAVGQDSHDEPWTVGVQDPHAEAGLVGMVRLHGDAIATSGDYMRSFTDDRRHHHILDPRTGRSPLLTSSVSVTAPTAMEADALSTALLVLGPSEGIDLVERTPGAEGLIVTKAGVRRRSSGMLA